MNLIKQINRLKKLNNLIASKNTGTPTELATKLQISRRRLYVIINLTMLNDRKRMGIIMKIFLTFCVLTFVLKNTSGQDVKRNTIKINPTIMLFPVWNIQYERRIRASQTIQVAYSRLDQAYFVDTQMDGDLFTIDYRFYRTGKRKSVVYLGPYLRYQKISFEGNDHILQNGVGGGITLGKVFKITHWLVFDLNGGINYMPTRYRIVEKVGTIDLPLPITLMGLGPRIGFSLGANF